MTPKEQYEARRAARGQRLSKHQAPNDRDADEFMDLADRFVTAVERIADALERDK